MFKLVPVIYRSALPALRSLGKKAGSQITVIGASAAASSELKLLQIGSSTAKVSIASRIGGFLAKHKSTARDFLLYAGFDALVSNIWGDKDSTPTEDDKEELGNILKEAIDDNLGYSEVRARAYSDSSSRFWTSSRAYWMRNTITDFLFRKDIMSGLPAPDSMIYLFRDLSDHERLLLVNQLAIAIKVVAASSDSREAVLLAGRQSLCCSNPSPVLSTGSEFLINRSVKSTSFEVHATAMNGMYEGLVNELASSAAADLFDESSAFVDFFDLFSSNAGSTASDETICNMAIAHIFYKGSPTSLGDGLRQKIREFSIDSDGNDDESVALELVQSVNRIHPVAKRFIFSMNKDENVRTDAMVS